MIYANAFGKSSSKVLLGTTYFGDGISQNDAFAIMDKFAELGGNHIDTARTYADGESEKLIGLWLKSRNPKDMIVSSKGGFPDVTGASRLSEKEIRFDLDKSLLALGTDKIDFYWLHRDDKNIPSGQIVEMMNVLVREGKIVKFGASNWESGRIDEANQYAQSHGLIGFEASQIRFSPAVIAPGGNDDPTLVDMNENEMKFYRMKNMPVAAFASQAKGFFAKYAQLGESGLSVKSKNRYFCEENIRRYEIIISLADSRNCSVGAAVCGVMCSLSGIFPIIGCSSVSQLCDSMTGADITFTKEETEKIFMKKD